MRPTNSMLRKSGAAVDWGAYRKDMPSVREESGNDGKGDKALNPRDAKEFRGLAVRANFLAQHRPDIPFATKEV